MLYKKCRWTRPNTANDITVQLHMPCRTYSDVCCVTKRGAIKQWVVEYRKHQADMCVVQSVQAMTIHFTWGLCTLLSQYACYALNPSNLLSGLCFLRLTRSHDLSEHLAAISAWLSSALPDSDCWLSSCTNSTGQCSQIWLLQDAKTWASQSSAAADLYANMLHLLFVSCWTRSSSTCKIASYIALPSYSYGPCILVLPLAAV